MKLAFPFQRRCPRGLATAWLAIVLVSVSACGGSSDSNDGTGDPGPGGDPTSGGVLRMMQVTEPRTLDPATMINSQGLGEVVGNSLYGTLVYNDSETGELIYDMAESLESSDGGTNWTLKIQPGIEFSDGTPFDAEAVRYNWAHTADPAVGSTSAGHASKIVSYNVVDDTTLEFGLDAPQANFPLLLVAASMTWIASPAALEEGPEAFDENPVGAGPFVLKSWSRGGALELVRNENYFEQEQPYLDGITVTTVPDPNQRVDSVIGGDADLVPASTATARTKATDSGFQAHMHPINSGNIIALNTTKPPFDDIRAREAFVKAMDLDVMNSVINQGQGETIETLFSKGQTLYSDVPIRVTDKERAQELFDEIAAEGEPLEFTIIAANNPDLAEAAQTQLGSFENVTVNVEKVEPGESTTRLIDGNYQALTNGAPFADPDSWAFTWFHSSVAFNVGKVKDPELDALIEEARTISDVDERRKIWANFQEKIAEQYPFVWTVRPERSYVAATNVGGIVSYGNGSVKTEGLWLGK